MSIVKPKITVITSANQSIGKSPQGTNEDLKLHSARENPSDLQLTFGEQQNQRDLLRKVVKSSLKQTNSRV